MCHTVLSTAIPLLSQRTSKLLNLKFFLPSAHDRDFSTVKK